MGTDQDDIVIMPLRTVQRRMTGNQDVDTILVSVRGRAVDRPGEGAITDAAARAPARSRANEDDDFNVLDTRQIAETLTGTTQGA